MTKAFYKQGELPISVYTYDQQSMKSVVLSQLTDSVYQRLMRSMVASSFSRLSTESITF